jgi:biopolymer transport protein ExbD
MHRQTQTQKREHERKYPPEEDPEFQIAPMIDILLVLLVFFMSISSTEVLQSNHKIQLPIAADGKAAKKNPGQIIVNITWVALNNIGAIEVQDRPYSQPGEIIPILQKAIQANPLVRVLIRADKAVRYEYLRSVLDILGKSGISNVTFSVVDKEGAKAE